MPQLIENENQFDELISSENLSVVHFSAKWSEQCKLINDVLTELSKLQEYKDVKLCYCEAEDLSELSLKHKIEAVPTILLFKKSKQVDRIDGADPKLLTEKINKQQGITETTLTKTPLEERLKQLINRHKIMIFMKGNREQPRCGFSKQIIQLVKETGVEYDTFDILQDEEVRQGLKTYSDWPTYPQLYVKGDLIGGLDIIKEMHAAGEFITTLKS